MSKSTKIDAPSHWASYLINGDDSGLTLAEQAQIARWLKSEGLFDQYAAGCEPAGHMKFDGLLTECETYTFIGA